MTGSVEDPDTITYAYLLNGEIDSTELTDWSVTETTEEAILAAAQELEPGATLEDGFIKFPEPEVAP
jgi:hypothetical protein